MTHNFGTLWYSSIMFVQMQIQWAAAPAFQRLWLLFMTFMVDFMPNNQVTSFMCISSHHAAFEKDPLIDMA